MAMAWSRISSKVIAHPPEADEACRRRCGNGKGRVGVCIPHMVDKRKQEVLGARDAESTPHSQTRGGKCRVRLALTFRTLFRTFEAILEEPPAERGAGATYRLLHAL